MLTLSSRGKKILKFTTENHKISVKYWNQVPGDTQSNTNCKPASVFFKIFYFHLNFFFFSPYKYKILNIKQILQKAIKSIF